MDDAASEEDLLVEAIEKDHDKFAFRDGLPQHILKSIFDEENIILNTLVGMHFEFILDNEELVGAGVFEDVYYWSHFIPFSCADIKYICKNIYQDSQNLIIYQRQLSPPPPNGSAASPRSSVPGPRPRRPLTPRFSLRLPSFLFKSSPCTVSAILIHLYTQFARWNSKTKTLA